MQGAHLPLGSLLTGSTQYQKYSEPSILSTQVLSIQSTHQCSIQDERGPVSLGNVGSKDTSICLTHHARRLFGQEVALKSVDAYNSPHLIPHLQCEADVLSGARWGPCICTETNEALPMNLCLNKSVVCLVISVSQWVRTTDRGSQPQ